MTRRPAVIAIAVLVAAATAGVAACKKDAPSASIASGSAGAPDGGADGSPAVISGAGDAWASAASLEAEDLSRLALREGSAGLVAGATTPERRRVAVLALAFADDLDGLPLLGEVAGGPDAELALAATESAAALASRPRTALDPEDALELREGCDRFAAVAKDATKPKPLRLKSVRVLRMLEDRGCARDLPKVE